MDGGAGGGAVPGRGNKKQKDPEIGLFCKRPRNNKAGVGGVCWLWEAQSETGCKRGR